MQSSDVRGEGDDAGSMRVEEFRAAHLQLMMIQERQKTLSRYMTNDMTYAVEQSGWGYTAIGAREQILACAGIVPQWHGRGLAWAYLSDPMERHEFLFVHRAVKRFLDTCFIKRIEMAVDCDFEEGHRWARLLGFKVECERMEAYRPDGGACALYSRVLN